MKRFTHFSLALVLSCPQIFAGEPQAVSDKRESSTSHSLADRFAAAWKAGNPLPSLSSHAPDLSLDDAYDLQKHWVNQTLEPSGIGGIKGGAVASGAQKALKIEAPVGAILRVAGRFEAKDKPVVSRKRFPGLRLETEIAFVVGKAIEKPPVDLDEFKKQICAIVPAIELVAGEREAPEEKPTAADLAAINVLAAGYIVGEPIDPAILDPREVTLSFLKDGEELHSATAADCWSGPWETAHWLAHFAHRQGVTLQPGHVILCGALGEIQPGDEGSYVYDAGKLGKIVFAVEQKWG